MNQHDPEDYAAYRLNRAKETLYEVQNHIDNKFWNTAINRMYYACFYAVGALLVKNGVVTGSHSGTRQKFGQLFVKTGKIDRDLAKLYTELFAKRSKGDYNDFFDFEEEDVVRLYPRAIEFVNQVENLLEVVN